VIREYRFVFCQREDSFFVTPKSLSFPVVTSWDRGGWCVNMTGVSATFLDQRTFAGGTNHDRMDT
jgi:hypothetical protein